MRSSAPTRFEARSAEKRLFHPCFCADAGPEVPQVVRAGATRPRAESGAPQAHPSGKRWAGFRDNATATITPLSRLESLTLPALDDVRDGLADYREAVAEAEALDEKIERTDDLIDEIVYDLYGLTEEEIKIVEEAVGG